MNRKRLFSILASLGLLVSLLGAPVSVQANQGACQPPPEYLALVGMDNSSSAVDRSGVTANFSATIQHGFVGCSGSLNELGPMAWVGLQPKPGACTAPDPSDCLLQLGVRYEVSTGSLRYFWARGGCGGARPLFINLGYVGNTLTHQYWIWLDTDQLYHLRIDNVPQLTIAKSDPAISCWTGGQMGHIMADWIYERHDTGESVGDIGFKSTMSIAQYGRYGLGWFDPGWVIGNPCIVHYKPDDGCSIISSDYATVFTSN